MPYFNSLEQSSSEPLAILPKLRAIDDGGAAGDWSGPALALGSTLGTPQKLVRTRRSETGG